MQVATGKSILNGVAIGPLRVFRKEETTITVESSRTPAEEWARFEAACEQAKEQLGALFEKALDEVGEENAAIFEIHQMMLEDDDYLETIQNIIETQGTTAEYATATTGENFSATFAAVDDAYMQARAADVKDISERVVNILSGRTRANLLGDDPVILVADDLNPSETVQLDKSKLLGFITRYGSSNSHTAILARTMNIPALIGVGFEADWNGKLAVLDGYNGCVYVEPTADLLSTMERLTRRWTARKSMFTPISAAPPTLVWCCRTMLVASACSAANSSIWRPPTSPAKPISSPFTSE